MEEEFDETDLDTIRDITSRLGLTDTARNPARMQLS